MQETNHDDKILIADDEPNILISLEYLMKREGYVVHVARDGQEALDVLRRERPRLVLLDVMMPRKSGIEVCQELRGDEAIKDTLVLMLTAKGRDTDVAKGLGVGADAYMTKPFATKDLVAKVRDMLAAPTPACRPMKIDRHLVQATAAGRRAGGRGAAGVCAGRGRAGLGHADAKQNAGRWAACWAAWWPGRWAWRWWWWWPPAWPCSRCTGAGWRRRCACMNRPWC
jgi:CheY-like chemotaxis protein